jgi:hypothetical protein
MACDSLIFHCVCFFCRYWKAMGRLSVLLVSLVTSLESPNLVRPITLIPFSLYEHIGHPIRQRLSHSMLEVS